MLVRPPTDLSAPLVHVGRQGIYDQTGDVVAYELSFRDAADAPRASSRGPYATSRVIVSAFTDFGLEQLVGAKACFINVTREFLVGELPIPFDTGHAALEIVPSVEVDDEVVEGATHLVERGFTIALSAFEWGSGHERLLDIASYVMMDMRGADPAQVDSTIQRCRDYPHLRLIAERLETEEQLQVAFLLGFDLFRGNILGRPHVLSTTGLSPARVSRLQLLAALSAEDVNYDDVVDRVAMDPTLAYRLLRATNSAASGLTVKVSSVHEAAVFLGLDKVRQWVTLMLLTDVSEATEDQLASTMTRARLCQTTAEFQHLPGSVAFTIGLLSGIAELTGRSVRALADELPLADEVREALTEGSGDLGEILTAVRHYEEGAVSELAALTGPVEPTEAYLSAISWSTKMLDDVGVEGARRPMPNPPA
ncbi:EAL and HDOD domain-containing protein [Cryptosporangium arvum]|uniref:EAL and HDOD domain-containing protein n=1 Tax=Cryptosporangium arvum TaxID=80871 RepID=UPI0006853159|nr:HDOD domain-containing protein [Cryptosporangium arvum]